MKSLLALALPLVFAATTAVSGVAHAATYSSDADRRTQNREEALANWRAANGQTTARTTTKPSSERPTLRQRTHNTSQSVKGFTHRQAERTRSTSQSVKRFTHRQAETVRNFGARQDRRLGNKFGKGANTSANPDGGGGK